MTFIKMRFTLVLLLTITQKYGHSRPIKEDHYNVYNSSEIETEVLHRYKVLAAQNSFYGMSKPFRVLGTEFHQAEVSTNQNVVNIMNSQYQSPETEIFRNKAIAIKNAFAGMDKQTLKTQLQTPGAEINKNLVNLVLDQNDFPGINNKSLKNQNQNPHDDPFFMKIKFNQESSTSGNENKPTLYNKNPSPGPDQETNKQVNFIGRSSPNNKKNEFQHVSVSTTESVSVDINAQTKCIEYQKHIPTPEELNSVLLTLWQIIIKLFIYILCYFSQCVC